MSKRIATLTEESSICNNSQDITYSANEDFHNNGNKTWRFNLESGHDAFMNANFSKVLDVCDIIMNSIVKEQLHVLDLRAATLIMMGDFKKAEEDATLLVDLAPLRSIGYIRLGELWMLRGNQKQAIKVYEKGLSLMENKEDLNLLALQRDKAVQKSNLKFDIFANLPYKLANLILKELDQNQRFILLDVSKVWRDKASRYASVWATIDFQEYGISEDCLVRNIQLLPLVCNHVTELLGPRTCLLRDALYAQLIKGEFNKLQKLYLYSLLDSYTPTLIPALSSVSKTLECLEIDIKNIPVVDLQKMTEACTELRSLTIRDATPIALEKIQQSCKQLERFKIDNSIFESNFRDGDNTMKIKKAHDQQFGINTSFTSAIRDFSLDIYGTPKNYISFILENQATIQMLHLKIQSSMCFTDVGLENREDWKILGKSCKFPDLQSLNFQSCNILFTPVIIPLLQNSPRIRLLFMDCIDFQDFHQDFITEIVNMPCLQTLGISGGYESRSDVQNFFRALGAKGKTEASTLETIKLSQTSFKMEDIVDSLADIQTLRHIEFHYLMGSSGRGYLYQLSSRLQHHPNIRSISLKSISCVNDKVLAHLAAIQELEHVHLQDLYGITTQGVSVFDNTSIKLTTKNCRNVVRKNRDT